MTRTHVAAVKRWEAAAAAAAAASCPVAAASRCGGAATCPENLAKHPGAVAVLQGTALLLAERHLRVHLKGCMLLVYKPATIC